MPYEYMCASVKRCAIITDTSTIKVTQPSVTLPYENLSLIFLFSFQSSSTRKPCRSLHRRSESRDKQPLDRKPPGGTRYILGWGGAARAPHILTLFKTKIADFPTLFKTEFRFLKLCLRHLTRNHTLCETINNIETLSYLSIGNHKTIYSCDKN